MKKFVALLLAMLLVLVNVAALAEDTNDPQEPVVEAKSTQGHDYFFKTYDIQGNVNTIVPHQALKFTVSVPQGVTNPGAEMISVAEAGYTAPLTEDKITFTVPESFAKEGLYKYIIKETATSNTAGSEVNNTKGMTYTTTEVHVDVYVTLDPETKQQTITPIVYLTKNDEKTDTITNTLEVGTIQVKKTLSGNLANADKFFQLTVTLTSENGAVWNDVTLVPSNAANAKATNSEGAAFTGNVISGNGWTSQTVLVTLKKDATLDFQDLPKGVKVAVEETGIGDTIDGTMSTIRKISADEQAEKINDQTAYTVTGEKTGTNAVEIAKGSNSAIVVNNNKEITIPTGIMMDTIPYVAILAIAMMGVAMLITRKRKEY